MIAAMAIELMRLGFGFLIFFFHRPIADYIRQQDCTLVLLLRQRGVPIPAALGTEAVRNIWFLLGTFAGLYQLARIWLALHS
jgi:hypothetical protein